jgi:hypothetical protein
MIRLSVQLRGCDLGRNPMELRFHHVGTHWKRGFTTSYRDQDGVQVWIRVLWRRSRKT